MNSVCERYLAGLELTVTVTRLINAYELAVKKNPETGIEDFLADRPKYKSRTYTPRVVRDAVNQEIDKWLKENDRRRNNGMRKQCLKCTDIQTYIFAYIASRARNASLTGVR